MSSRTRDGKVADKATNGIPLGNRVRRTPISPYFFRKPDPQCDMTWASSITMESMRRASKRFLITFFVNLFVSSISGEITTT